MWSKKELLWVIQRLEYWEQKDSLQAGQKSKKNQRTALEQVWPKFWISRIKINPIFTQAEREVLPTKTDPNLSLLANARICEKS